MQDLTPPRGDGVANVFMGTPQFAVHVLRHLAQSPHRPRLVITPPDRRKGRGRHVGAPPVADAARELGLDLLQVRSVNEPGAVERIRAAEPEVAIVCAFGQLIKEPLLSDLPMLNVHPSLLPRWRGAAPLERAIMAGDRETGVTIMRLTEGLDSGPIALQERLEIDKHEDYGSLAKRLAELSGPMMVRALEAHAAGELSFAEQDDSHVTYAEKIAADDRRLDPSRPASELDATVRALHPHIGAYLELAGGERLGIGVARTTQGDLEPGSLTARDGELLLGCAEGALALEEVQPPGKRPMPADAYLRGHQVPAQAL